MVDVLREAACMKEDLIFWKGLIDGNTLESSKWIESGIDSFEGYRNQKFALHVLNELAKEAERLVGEKFVNAYLFGSYSRGDFTEDSDIDVAIVLDCSEKELNREYYYLVGDRKFALFYVSSILIHPFYVTKEIFDKQDRHLLRVIKREGIPWRI